MHHLFFLISVILNHVIFPGYAYSNIDTHDIAIDSRGYVFVGTEGKGIYRSVDNGRTIDPIGLYGCDVETIGISRRDYIFAGIEFNGVYRSTDAGEHWTAVNTGLPDVCSVWSFAFISPDSIIIGANEGAFFSKDSGETWKNIGFTDIMVRDVAIPPEGGIVAVVQHDGIYKTYDYGNNWLMITDDTRDVFVTQFLISDNGYWYAGTWGEGVYRSTDRGSKFIKMSYGMGDAYINYMARDAEDNIYACTHGYHGDYEGAVLYRSTNRGNNWFRVFPALNVPSVKALAFHPDGSIYAGSWYADGLYRSTDGGSAWYAAEDTGMVHIESDTSVNPALSVSPNPFNVSTTIEFVLSEHSHAALVLFNSSGRKVRTLVNDTLPAGKHTAVWDGRDENGLTVSSGLYFSRLVTEQYSGTAKMLLIK